MLNVNKKVEDGKLILSLEGRIDTLTAPQLESEAKSEIDNVNEMEMDFSKVEYISSAGLRVLLSCHKAMSRKGGMVVKNTSDAINEIFEVTGFSDILNIE